MHKRRRFNPWVGKIPWRRKRQPTAVLENPMDRGAWQATVQRVTKSWTQLSLHAWRWLVWGVLGCRKGSCPNPTEH